MVKIPDIWSIFEAVEAIFEAVNALGDLIDAVGAAGGRIDSNLTQKQQWNRFSLLKNVEPLMLPMISDEVLDIWSKLTVYTKFQLWLNGRFGYMVNFSWSRRGPYIRDAYFSFFKC